MVSSTNAVVPRTRSSPDKASFLSLLQNTLFPESSAQHGSLSHRHFLAQCMTSRRMILDSETTRHSQSTEERLTPSSSSSSLAYRFQGHTLMPYYDSTFLHHDSLILCCSQKGVDLIQLPRGCDNNPEYIGKCVGTASHSTLSSSSLQTGEHEPFPYLGTKSLWSGKAFVTGTRKGSYTIFDTNQSVRSAQWSSTSRHHQNPMVTHKQPTLQQSSSETISSIPVLKTILGPVRRATFRSLQRQWLQQQHNNPLTVSYYDDHRCTPTSTCTRASDSYSLNDPSWDFFETNHHSFLAMHVGRERDYIAIHDNREKGSQPSSNINHHHLLIHQEKDTHRFDVACFVNEHAIATTKSKHTKDPTISLWDIRHVRRPIDKTRLVHDPVEAFPAGDVLMEGNSPIRDISLRSKIKTASIRHMKAMGSTGQLHVVTENVICSPDDDTQPNGIHQYFHWTVDCLSRECRRIHVQTCKESDPWSFHSSDDGLPPFAMQQDAHGAGILACASFPQVDAYQNEVVLSLHRAGSHAGTQESRKKRKQEEESSNKSQRFWQQGAASWKPGVVVDSYGLATPITKLAWNGDGSHLVGLSASSDLYVWGSY